MAIRDVKEYYWKLIAQKDELARDYADFEEALRNGYITEDKLTEVKDMNASVQNNVDRVGYILYLLEMPNKKSKKAKYGRANKALHDEFERRNATDANVIDENKSLLDGIRAELKKLTEE